MMAVQEESGDHARLAKGRRTKRQRLQYPIVATTTSTSSISSDGGKSPEEARGVGKPKETSIMDREDNNYETTVVNMLNSSTDDNVTRNSETRRATTEDEDMANCLMLLKQGHRSGDQTQKFGFLNYKKPPTSDSPSSLGLGLDAAYHCKTCDKSFSSFQALGGHRASHKKPRNVTSNNEIINVVQEKKSPVVAGEKQESEHRVMNSSFLSLQVTSSSWSSYTHSIKKSDRTHECSICKAEFSSGQALGGHMRRHRNANVTGTTTTTSGNVGNLEDKITSSSDRRSLQEYSNKRQMDFPELDLNLPAPEDDRHEKPRFSIASKDQILVFAAAASS